MRPLVIRRDEAPDTGDCIAAHFRELDGWGASWLGSAEYLSGCYTIAADAIENMHDGADVQSLADSSSGEAVRMAAGSGIDLERGQRRLQLRCAFAGVLAEAALGRGYLQSCTLAGFGPRTGRALRLTAGRRALVAKIVGDAGDPLRLGWQEARGLESLCAAYRAGSAEGESCAAWQAGRRLHGVIDCILDIDCCLFVGIQPQSGSSPREARYGQGVWLGRPAVTILGMFLAHHLTTMGAANA